MRWDANGDSLTAGEIQHFRGDGDQRSRKFEIDAVVEDVLNDDVHFAVEGKGTMSRENRVGEAAIKRSCEGQFEVVLRCVRGGILRGR